LPAGDRPRDAVIDETERLWRARLLCACLREEGAISSVPRLVTCLADRLLASLRLS
jgi:hypothetical protein